MCVHNRRNQYMLAKDAKNPLALFDCATIFCQLLILIIIIITKPRLGKMSIYADLVGPARVCVCGAQTYSDHHLPQLTMFNAQFSRDFTILQCVRNKLCLNNNYRSPRHQTWLTIPIFPVAQHQRQPKWICCYWISVFVILYMCICNLQVCICAVGVAAQ